MTLLLCRLAPTAGSLEVRQGFVSYHRISTYSIWIITHIPLFVKCFEENSGVLPLIYIFPGIPERQQTFF